MPQPIILVPLDASDRARAALPVAGALSEVMHATSRIVHVSGCTFTNPMVLVERLGLKPAMLQRSSVDARVGKPAAEILAAAKEMGARLIVMCTHTASQRPQGILGTTALAVLRGTACPVVFVSPEQNLEGWRLRRVLVPHDGTPGVSAAIATAAELAKQAGAELLVVLAMGTGGAGPAEPGSLTPPLYLDQPQHEWPAWAREFIERFACYCPGRDLRMHMHLRCGRAGPEILRMAAEEAADLIVLAWKGEWTHGHADVLKAVIRDAPCPVIVTREKDQQRLGNQG
jgi:nucleotide-binding universal stress UspA family protein